MANKKNDETKTFTYHYQSGVRIQGTVQITLYMNLKGCIFKLI